MVLWLAGLGLWFGVNIVRAAISSRSPTGVLAYLAGSFGMMLGAVELSLVFLRSPYLKLTSYVAVLVLVSALITTIHYFGLGATAMGSPVGVSCSLPWMVEGMAYTAVTVGFHYLAAILICRVPRRRRASPLYCAAFVSLTASVLLLISRVWDSIESDYFDGLLLIFGILLPYVTSFVAVGLGLMTLQALIAQQCKWAECNETATVHLKPG